MKITGNYGNMDSCNIYVNRAATLDVKTFSTESGYDTLEINGVYYMGTVAVQLCGQITLLSARITGRRQPRRHNYWRSYP